MKKVFAMVLAILILFGTLPFNAAACEEDLKQEKLIDLACEVFPEYEEYFTNPPDTSMARSNTGIGEVVSTKTRNISDTESMTATLYSTGYVVVGYVYEDYKVAVSDSGSQVGSDFIGSVSFTVTTNKKGQGTFNLNSVGFIIHQNNTGYFTSYGKPSYYLVDPGTINESETNIDYHLTFYYGSVNLLTTFYTYIRDGNIGVEIY